MILAADDFIFTALTTTQYNCEAVKRWRNQNFSGLYYGSAIPFEIPISCFALQVRRQWQNRILYSYSGNSLIAYRCLYVMQSAGRKHSSERNDQLASCFVVSHPVAVIRKSVRLATACQQACRSSIGNVASPAAVPYETVALLLNLQRVR